MVFFKLTTLHGKRLRIQPKPQLVHLRVDNASSSAAPVYFTQCYLMLKASSNGFESCVFPHITLPPWKQLWQTAMKIPNRKPTDRIEPPSLFYLQNNSEGLVPLSADQKMQHASFHQKHWQIIDLHSRGILHVERPSFNCCFLEKAAELEPLFLSLLLVWNHGTTNRKWIHYRRLKHFWERGVNQTEAVCTVIK